MIEMIFLFSQNSTILTNFEKITRNKLRSLNTGKRRVELI